MPDEHSDNPKLVEWNLRGFPEDLRNRCQKLALDERSGTGKRPRDADIVARLIRQALGIPENDVLDSSHESRQRPIRRGSPAHAGNTSTEDRRNKSRKQN